MAAVEANDTTAIIEGCGNQPIAGYTYCRRRDGSPTESVVSFIVPPVDCGLDSCVNIKVYRPDSEIALGLNIPKGQTRLDVPWKMIVGRNQFTLGDRGFWPVIYQITYLDEKGRDKLLVVEGEIRLRVYSKDYLPLHESLDDPAFKWEFIESSTKIKMTTSGRTYVAPKVKHDLTTP